MIRTFCGTLWSFSAYCFDPDQVERGYRGRRRLRKYMDPQGIAAKTRKMPVDTVLRVIASKSVKTVLYAIAYSKRYSYRQLTTGRYQMGDTFRPPDATPSPPPRTPYVILGRQAQHLQWIKWHDRAENILARGLPPPALGAEA